MIAQVEEIGDFTQEDMLEDDVMLLDVGTCVYLWIGSGCNEEEKTKSMETAMVSSEYAVMNVCVLIGWWGWISLTHTTPLFAQDYNKQATDGRDPDIPIIEIKSGCEPLLFTQFFPGWDPAFAEKNKFLDP